MKKFIETICINELNPRNLEWHQERINATFQYGLDGTKPFSLQRALEKIDIPSARKVKCSVIYDSEIRD
ncbi:MAG TPA: hypothetical protein VJ508_03095, partial [Saprospiraceae bacterium]|nr:hypothetical protein [Saprospiraceae bacterium]